MAVARAALTMELRAVRREVEELFKRRDLTFGRALDKDQAGRYFVLIAREVDLLSELAVA